MNDAIDTNDRHALQLMRERSALIKRRRIIELQTNRLIDQLHQYEPTDRLHLLRRINEQLAQTSDILHRIQIIERCLEAWADGGNILIARLSIE